MNASVTDCAFDVQGTTINPAKLHAAGLSVPKQWLHVAQLKGYKSRQCSRVVELATAAAVLVGIPAAGDCAHGPASWV